MAAASALRFTHLSLRNWRNLRSVDMDLSARSVIIGPNASGKSNLLDAVRFLAEIARPGTGGLRAAVEARGGYSDVRCLHARNPSQIEITATIGNDAQPKVWTYHLRIDRKGKEPDPTVATERVTHHQPSESARQVAEQFRNGSGDPFAYSQTLMEQAAQSHAFRELQAFLSSCRYLHVVPQIVRDRRRTVSDMEDPFGGDLLRRVAETLPRSREARLRRISEALQIAVPQFVSLDLEVDRDGVPHLAALFRQWRPNASRQIERSFSDGTLRLIGLLWAMSDRGGPLLLEEPELSLNDAIVRILPDMLRRMQRLSRRQVLLTTHSPALLDGGDLGLAEVFCIEVGNEGSRVERLSDNPALIAQTQGGSTISEAVTPLLTPLGVDKLSKIDFAA